MSYDATLRAAYDHCKKIALGHYENFPVGSILLPKKVRPHVYALYAFMRSADDFADLPGRPAEERLKLLSDWRDELALAVKGTPSENPIFIALANTISEFGIDPALLHALLDAFTFDAKGEVTFATFSDLHWYTKRSAEPVGRLILTLFNYHDQERAALSDDICTALQLLNFVQDAREDLTNGRLYFPLEDLARFDLKQEELLTSERTPELLLYECDRVEQLLTNGAALTEMVNGRLRWELRAVVLGAMMMLKKIRAVRGNTIHKRPKLSSREHRAILMGAIVGAKIK